MRLPNLLDQNMQMFGEYPFLFFGDTTYTNFDVLKHANQIAQALLQIGIKEHDRVIVCMPNSPEVIFSYQGISRAGATIIPVLYLLHSLEIAYLIQHSQAKAVITSSVVLEKLKEACKDLQNPPRLLVFDQTSDEFAANISDLIQHGDSNLPELPVHTDDTTADDVAVILYTSGTTGKPKGVMLTHRNLISNASNSASMNQLEPGVTIGVLPLAHVYGLTVSNICYLTGSSLVVFSKFDPVSVFQAIETYKVRSFSVVPAMIHAMLAHPDSSKYNLSSLESVGSGSASLPLAYIDAFKQKFNADIYEGYGLSEASPIVSAYRKGMAYKPGSVGIPLPGVEIAIVNSDGNPLPTGEVGELIVRGDNVTPGYYDNEEATRSTLKNGWLYTGDLAKVDEDGYLFIVDRKKDLIIRGGFNVYPRDIEELLLHHPSISDAAAVGIPSEKMGEDVVAFVVLKPGEQVTQSEIITYCQEHLAKYKTPQYVCIVDALPRNGVGKILKTRLREIASNVTIHIKQCGGIS